MILEVLCRRLKRRFRVKHEWGQLRVWLDGDDSDGYIGVSCGVFCPLTGRVSELSRGRLSIFLRGCVLIVNDPTPYLFDDHLVHDKPIARIDLNDPGSVRELEGVIQKFVDEYVTRSPWNELKVAKQEYEARMAGR